MSFFELAKQRYSCRKFNSKIVPKDILVKVLECARIAPSATNAQPWRFVVVTKSPLIEQIIGCYARPWLQTAPAIIVACGDHSTSWRRADGKDHCDIDLAIAIDHITLAATDNGLATCWICKFDALKCAELLKLPSHISPIAMIPIGYPHEESKFSEKHIVRKSFDEIVSWEGFDF
jgi:nitroreductase